MTALTSADVNMVVVAAQIIKARSWAWSLMTMPGEPEIHMPRREFRSLCEVMGVQPTFAKRAHDGEYPLEAKVKIGGVTFFCINNPAQAAELGMVREVA